jgi:hypothetical protein
MLCSSWYDTTGVIIIVVIIYWRFSDIIYNTQARSIMEFSEA